MIGFEVSINNTFFLLITLAGPIHVNLKVLGVNSLHEFSAFK